MGHRLLLSNSRPSLILKPALSAPSSLCQAIVKNCGTYTEGDNDDDDRVIGEKARSTAEEFSRVAKEKAEVAKRSQTVDATLEGSSASIGESNHEEAKQKFKKTVEKGAHDNKSKE